MQAVQKVEEILSIALLQNNWLLSCQNITCSNPNRLATTNLIRIKCDRHTPFASLRSPPFTEATGIALALVTNKATLFCSDVSRLKGLARGCFAIITFIPP